jgi:transposase
VAVDHPSRAEEARHIAKKKSLIPAEQQRPDVQRRRELFSIACKFVPPKQFVFLDESGAKTNMTRLYGRAAVGERCRFFQPHGHWKTMTLLSAIRIDGVIREATALFDGPMNAPTFLGYVQEMLAPSLKPGDVVVMDNLSSHKVAGVEQAVEAVGASVWYLPPYSPDLNPIERVWSKVKTWLRRVAAKTLDALWPEVAAILNRVSASECQAYFRAAGHGEG